MTLPGYWSGLPETWALAVPEADTSVAGAPGKWRVSALTLFTRCQAFAFDAAASSKKVIDSGRIIIILPLRINAVKNVIGQCPGRIFIPYINVCINTTAFEKVPRVAPLSVRVEAMTQDELPAGRLVTFPTETLFSVMAILMQFTS